MNYFNGTVMKDGDLCKLIGGYIINLYTVRDGKPTGPEGDYILLMRKEVADVLIKHFLNKKLPEFTGDYSRFFGG